MSVGILFAANPVFADEDTDAGNEAEEASKPEVDYTGGKSRGLVYDSGSIKAQLGSLGQSEEGRALLDEFDTEQGYTADPGAEYEAVLNSATYKDNGFTKKDLKYLASIIFCEANSMSHDAKVAVANVVINRMKDTGKDWGHVNTIHDVIYDNKWGVQFSPTLSSTRINMDYAMNVYTNLNSGNLQNWQVKAMNECIAAAKAAMSGYISIPENYVYFNGYIDKSRNKCKDRGSTFSIMNTHIYFTTEALDY